MNYNENVRSLNLYGFILSSILILGLGLSFVVSWSVDIYIFVVTFTVVTAIYLLVNNSVIVLFFDILTNYEYNLKAYLISIKLMMEAKLYIFSKIYEKFYEVFNLILKNCKDFISVYKTFSLKLNLNFRKRSVKTLKKIIH